MAELSFREIVEAVGGALVAGSPAGTVRGYSIDSRKVRPGDLFFAIVGPNLDGHAFLPDALQAGAAGCVVSRTSPEWEGRPGAAFIRAADTTRALQDLAAYVRGLWPIRVIGVTGTTGKTTTKELLFSLLEPDFGTIRTEGNLNNQYGLPLSLLFREKAHTLAVLEMGMSTPGEITRLAEIAHPCAAVYTVITPVHMENFSSLAGVAAAKKELVDSLPPDGVVFVNADDPWVCRITADFPGTKVRYGLSTGADVFPENIREGGLDGTSCDLSTFRGPVSLRVPLPGLHNLKNALAALAAALYFGVRLEAAAARIESFRAVAMRGRITRFAEGFTLYDDSYNSNPRAFEEALSTLAKTGAEGKKIVVAGDMLELGQFSKAEHFEAGRRVAGAGIDILVAVGPEAAAIAEGAREGGMKPESVFHFQTADDAAPEVASRLGPGDLILVKGSRGIGTDRVVRALFDRCHPE
jgi:UDP-N-acetylmuramoyl-tripeptide--D-alanyl-D-alanine ligase